ncbi:MAG: AAA family ATPase [Actinobacteria bacterium]|nr:AAA family ATPase [Actinomycetota bacterium]MBW3642010.1 AAA family ATPase [Actinomycetota bacterium]
MTAPPADLDQLVNHARVLVCCGSGGVGKTTTAATLALQGAKLGRRAVVVTIDPAKRLADTLGIGSLTNTPIRIEGSWPGELWAMMLDTKSTFDQLVIKHSTDAAQAQRILGNRFYRNISGALSGTQEYMAGEKLYELHDEADFDLVVVDTPPAHNALDFIDASRRLTNFLDHRLYRMLMTPTRAYLRAVNLAAQAFVRTVSKVIGGEVLEDALAFFSAFEGMEEGFRQRAEGVQALLAAEATAFVLVASPRADAVAEARFFADRLRESNIAVAALIVNRVHPQFSRGHVESDRAQARLALGTALEPLYTNLADLRALAEGEETNLADLGAQVEPASVTRVPLLEDDVHDLVSLDRIAAHLFGR